MAQAHRIRSRKQLPISDVTDAIETSIRHTGEGLRGALAVFAADKAKLDQVFVRFAERVRDGRPKNDP